MTLWNINISVIENYHECPFAKELLYFLSILAETAIPKELVGVWFQVFYPKNIESDLIYALMYLEQYSLLETRGEHYYIHPVIQKVIHYHFTKIDNEKYFDKALKAFVKIMKDKDLSVYSTSKKLAPYIPHMERLIYLFLFERVAWARTPEERLKIRQEKEVPLINELISITKEKLQDRKILPKSKLREALGYFCSLVPYLKSYTKHAEAHLDNNVAERAIRPLVVGRKNWIFVGVKKEEIFCIRSVLTLRLIHPCDCPFAHSPCCGRSKYGKETKENEEKRGNKRLELFTLLTNLTIIYFRMIVIM